MSIYTVKPTVKLIREESWFEARKDGRRPTFTLRIEADGHEWIVDGYSTQYWIDHFQFLRDAPKISGHVLRGYFSAQSVAWEKGRDTFTLDEEYTNRAIKEASATVTHGVSADMGSEYGYMADWEEWLWYGFTPKEARELAGDYTPKEAHDRYRFKGAMRKRQKEMKKERE